MMNMQKCKQFYTKNQVQNAIEIRMEIHGFAVEFVN